MNKREIERNKLADNVCREVRYQMSKHGCIGDTDSLFRHLAKWLMIAKKDKFDRPE